MSAPRITDEARRIALLAPCYWPEVRRGAERIIREIADGVIGAGHRARLITSHPGTPSRSVEDGLEVVRNWRPPDGRLRRRLYEDYLTHVPFSYVSLMRGDDDLAHATYPTDALAATRWARQRGCPALFTYMGIPERPWLAARRGRIAITRRAALESDAVVMLSQHAAAACRRWLGVEAHVIYPGVDLDVFRPDVGRTEAPTVFCAAAADEPRKRIGLLVSAFRLVRRERPGARLLLVRPSANGSSAATAAREVEGVELLDSVERPEDLAPTYASAWVSALPSLGDSFGLVLAEALACGTPVVGSRDGAIPEVVDRDEIGRLFDGDDERVLARALLEAFELAQDPATTGACRDRAQEFSTERSGAQYLALYDELLAEA